MSGRGYGELADMRVGGDRRNRNCVPDGTGQEWGGGVGVTRELLGCV